MLHLPTSPPAVPRFSQLQLGVPVLRENACFAGRGRRSLYLARLLFTWPLCQSTAAFAPAPVVAICGRYGFSRPSFRFCICDPLSPKLPPKKRAETLNWVPRASPPTVSSQPTLSRPSSSFSIPRFPIAKDGFGSPGLFYLRAGFGSSDLFPAKRPEDPVDIPRVHLRGGESLYPLKPQPPHPASFYSYLGSSSSSVTAAHTSYCVI